MRKLVMVLGLVLCAVWAESGSAATPTTAEITWQPTTDATIRYELRWSHFANGWAWTPIAGNLDSTAGRYRHEWAALPETPGDRGACWDARAVRGGLASPWLSESNQQQCLQVPLAAPIPTPVPLPTPEPTPVPQPEPQPDPNPAIVTMSGDKIFITCDPSRYAKASTTGRGTKRTITCLK